MAVRRAAPNPGAWLTTTATRKALDRIRRENKRGDKQKGARMLHDDDPPEPAGGIDDERLRLIFTCCHPALAARVPLFVVVVVGVDSRWLRGSLVRHYRNLLLEPENYLEKIFQIPYAIRPMTSGAYQDLVEGLASRMPDAGVRTAEARGAPGVHASVPDGRGGATAADHGSTPGVGDVAERGVGGPGPGDREQDGQPAGQSSDADRDGENGGSPSAGRSGTSPAAPLPRPEAHVLLDEERTLLGRVATLVSTPRAVKRLVNVYRMLRVSVPPGESDAFDPRGGREFEVVVVLLAILVGRPALAPGVFASIMSAGDDADAWSIVESCEELREPLTALRPLLTRHPVRVFRRCVPRVSRFSFGLTGALPRTGNPRVQGRRKGGHRRTR